MAQFKVGDSVWIRACASGWLHRPLKGTVSAILDKDIHPFKVTADNDMVFYCDASQIKRRQAQAAKDTVRPAVSEAIHKEALRLAQAKIDQHRESNKESNRNLLEKDVSNKASTTDLQPDYNLTTTKAIQTAAAESSESKQTQADQKDLAFETKGESMEKPKFDEIKDLFYAMAIVSELAKADSRIQAAEKVVNLAEKQLFQMIRDGVSE